MRDRVRGRRIKMFRRGNTACPICLEKFSEDDVRRGNVVNLEHVPAKGLKKQATPIGMCLTCSDCNQGASNGLDKAAMLAMQPPQATLELLGKRYRAKMTRDSDGTFVLRTTRPVNPVLLVKEPERDYVKLHFQLVNERIASVGFLRFAYLSVFSLLGKRGYRYALGEGASQVRHQIMNPDRAIIERSTVYDASKAKDSWIAMSLDSPKCWIVRIGEAFVFLPTSGDSLFYEKSEQIRREGTFTLHDYYLWKPVKFGRNVPVSFTMENRQNWRDLKRNLGGEPFGTEIRHTDENGTVSDFVVADYGQLDGTLLRVSSHVKNDQHEQKVAGSGAAENGPPDAQRL